MRSHELGGLKFEIAADVGASDEASGAFGWSAGLDGLARDLICAEAALVVVVVVFAVDLNDAKDFDSGARLQLAVVVVGASIELGLGGGILVSFEVDVASWANGVKHSGDDASSELMLGGFHRDFVVAAAAAG